MLRVTALVLALFYCANVFALEPIGWDFERDGVRGTLIPTVHYFPPGGSADRKFAISYRVYLRSLVEGASSIYFERYSSTLEPVQTQFPRRAKPLDLDTQRKIRAVFSGKDPRLVSTLLTQDDWLLAANLTAARAARFSSLTVLSGTEQEILRTGQKYSLTLSGLERPQMLMHAFQSLSHAAQHEMLADALVSDEAYVRELGSVERGLQSGCHMCVCTVIEAAATNQKEYWKKIVLNRNIEWMNTINSLPSGRRYLIAVRFARTCGQSAIQALMTKAGFTVKSVSK